MAAMAARTAIRSRAAIAAPSYGSASSGYPGSTTSTGPAGTSGVSGTGAGGEQGAALASSTSGTAGTGFGSSALERNTGVLGTPPAELRVGGSTRPLRPKPDDKGLGSTPPRGTNP